MRAEFLSHETNEAVLTSPDISVSKEQCLQIVYFSSSKDMSMFVRSNPPQYVTDGNTPFGIFERGQTFIRLPVGRYSLSVVVFNSVYSATVADLKTVLLYSFNVSNAPCPTVGTCTIHEIWECISTDIGWYKLLNRLPSSFEIVNLYNVGLPFNSN